MVIACLQLRTTGVVGPVALVGYIHGDFVERRGVALT